MISTRASEERGATLVEAAFVLPVMLLMMLAMMNLGLVILGNSVGSNAARDGARVGIINYLNAETDGTASHEAIEAAVNQRLAGHVGETPTVTVRCLDADDTVGNPTVKPCNNSIDEGRDLLEVKVTWDHVGGSIFVPGRSHTATVRLTIVGEANLDPGIPPPLQITVDNPTVVEGNPGDTRTLVFTVTRSYTTTAVSVPYTTAAGTTGTPATPGTDFTTTSGTLVFPVNGPSSLTVTVQIAEDTAVESNETVVLDLTAPSGAAAFDGAGTIQNDDVDSTPPVLQSVEIRDTSSNGRIDFLIATFNEPLGPCAGTWSFSDASGSATIQSTAVNGSMVQVFLEEPVGSSTFNTGPNVTVSGSGTCDLASPPNAAGLQTPPTIIDAAVPQVVGLTSTNVGGGTLGRAQSGDTVRFTMSESPTTASVPASLSVVLNGANGNNNDAYTMAGITAASASLGRNDYIASNNRTATFASSTTTLSGSTITITLGPACSGNGCANATQANSTAAGTGGVMVTPAATIRDAADNAAAGAVSFTIRLF